MRFQKWIWIACVGRWMGRTMVGKKRMRVWSCDGHVEGLEDLRAVPWD
jgi:hypothetical protein